MMTDKRIPAIKVIQWLDIWDQYNFDSANHQAKPEKFFLLFSMDAKQLKTLSGIYPRNTAGTLPRSQDLGIQRKHDPKRSATIRDFIHYGYPWTEISQARRETSNYDDLRKPGWLPTAIVINILKPQDARRGNRIDDNDLITIDNMNDNIVQLNLPKSYQFSDWEPKQIHPIEIIDGQHRLFSFDDNIIEGQYELPVVAFYGLDISWQAYLFWTINITPKRINPSLAFDLYPLLRTEDWLDRFEGPIVYRQSRAQELVELMWASPDSPWYQRINMLGERGQKGVTQSAWINSLLSTFIKSWDKNRNIGGLFGARIGQDETVLSWDRVQQAAFLIYAWKTLENNINNIQYPWANILRKAEEHTTINESSIPRDLAFSGSETLLNTDQGVRGVLYIVNDIFYYRAANEELDLDSWCYEQELTGDWKEDIPNALELLKSDKHISDLMSDIMEILAKFDWRTVKADGLNKDEKVLKLALRGSGGYKELRRQILEFLIQEDGYIGETAGRIKSILGY